MAELIRYKDIDLDFIAHPITNDVSTKINQDAIKRSLRNLIQFKRGDKPFHPEIASGVSDLLFEPAGAITTIRLKQEIERVITDYEPRVSLNRILVNLNDSNNSYDITIRFNILNEVQSVELKFALQRLR